mmetsp:Transcript_22226/g.56485  ORF Transcript_22226/g.56485 Transcript_22226/m.56485 type:complete len:469 (-) Transcript_22226:2852-4258(-)
MHCVPSVPVMSRCDRWPRRLSASRAAAVSTTLPAYLSCSSSRQLAAIMAQLSSVSATRLPTDSTGLFHSWNSNERRLDSGASDVQPHRSRVRTSTCASVSPRSCVSAPSAARCASYSTTSHSASRLSARSSHAPSSSTMISPKGRSTASRSSTLSWSSNLREDSSCSSSELTTCRPSVVREAKAMREEDHGCREPLWPGSRPSASMAPGGSTWGMSSVVAASSAGGAPRPRPMPGMGCADARQPRCRLCRCGMAADSACRWSPDTACASSALVRLSACMPVRRCRCARPVPVTRVTCDRCRPVRPVRAAMRARWSSPMHTTRRPAATSPASACSPLSGRMSSSDRCGSEDSAPSVSGVGRPRQSHSRSSRRLASPGSRPWASCWGGASVPAGCCCGGWKGLVGTCHAWRAALTPGFLAARPAGAGLADAPAGCIPAALMRAAGVGAAWGRTPSSLPPLPWSYCPESPW